MQQFRQSILLCIVAMSMLVAPPTGAKALPTDPEIEFLLSEIESSNCIFVRNGTEYSADRAAQHLRMKYDKARKYIANAQEFIEKLASESSWSGKPYAIVCSATGSQPSRAWLSARLVQFRAAD